ncbi:hypothetical protein L1N85_09055 [Paenibacillus alkaliterrae]|uniref:hypothetical protein n=1 Tax=Paenibacillus alkaliterrae TaxID=320909 RepID=UPI001F1D3737|nr:hypothetical protein [Paenibacillus alkaliterrae]MCF2938583.1 hypothetical protein [Paenibacillus alkaliterrae]
MSKNNFECDSIFMAATNLHEELDHAVWRRFDTKMTYGLPDDETRNEYIRLLIGDFGREEHTLEQAAFSLRGCSFADMEQIVLKAKRKAIIEGCALTAAHIRYSLEEYKPHLNAGITS